MKAAIFKTKPAAIFGTILAILLTSCTGVRPLKGGKAVTARATSGHFEQTLSQGDNPSQPSRQDQETIKIRTYALPAGSRFEQSPIPGLSSSRGGETRPPPGDAGAVNSSLRFSHDSPVSVVLSAPMPVVEREEIRAKTELGAAQKDTARELGAKLASLRGITWVGVGLFLFGLATLFWPPLKIVIGSVTTSVAITLGGLALMILPTLIVGNEVLILGAVTLVITAWFFAHRHGQLRGQLSLLPGNAGGSPAGSATLPIVAAQTPAPPSTEQGPGTKN